MKILVTNDDGINAEGIKKLVDALSDGEKTEVYVCAPKTQKSACGHGITIHDSMSVEEVSFENAVMAYSIDGTPADCVKVGLELLEERDVNIDMVFSGINMGGNLGTDVLYSGTVSAAIEGGLCGKPSVAVSVNSWKPKHYEYAIKLAVKAASYDIRDLDKEVIININTPNLPVEEIAGTKIVSLGIREYEEWFETVEKDDGNSHYQYAGRPVFRDDYDSDTNDIGASQEKYATITPLHYDLTNYELMKKLKEKGVWDE